MIDPNYLGEGEEMYKENILDHYRNPHNSGRIERCSFSHREVNPLCGDEIELFVVFEGKSVSDVRFEGRGCAISQASASMLTDFIKGKTREQILSITREDILALLGIQVGVVRLKCALLPLKTLHKGLGELEVMHV